MTSQRDPELRAAPRIVALGGGTGMSCLLTGLKSLTPRITAIVTVTDNGGSSGRLRKEFDMVPPGDIRNCLLALAEGEPLLRELLRYRFEESDLNGHSFGNLFITALTRVTGSFDVAVRELNRLLAVRGRVLPATDRKISLIAHHPDGTKSTGEVEITAAGKPIQRLEIRPRVRSIEPDVATAIAEAELMIFGPGSLFTSVIANLLVEKIVEGVRANPCPKIYVANIMTQPGETTGLTLGDHIAALEQYGGKGLISGVVVHRGEIPGALIERYAEQGAHPVIEESALAADPALEVVSGDLLDRGGTTIRHHPVALGQLIARSFLPREPITTA